MIQGDCMRVHNRNIKRSLLKDTDNFNVEHPSIIFWFTLPDLRHHDIILFLKSKIQTVMVSSWPRGAFDLLHPCLIATVGTALCSE